MLSEQIKSSALCWALGRAEVEEIDEINIFQASLLAMQRAFESLTLKPDYAVVDGKHCPKLACPTQAVIQGDRLIPAISAASIIAKVARDQEMLVLHEQYPDYDFARHKGYPTALHRELLRRFGASPIHRKSFGPVRNLSKP